ncbi:helix-turn-helix domain-containing protein [Elioraea sp.]|uniref:helix-turn-helix domain-containing protein n=1 Tax=Elioraea sp. TaxID=2185103 RepID=UPI003F6FBB2B
MKAAEKFGAMIRRYREAREISLREMASLLAVSPAFLSKVERDEAPPPGEENIKQIARVLELDPDVLLARAGKISSDLSEIIRRRPAETAALLRLTKRLDRDRLVRVIKAAHRVSKA